MTRFIPWLVLFGLALRIAPAPAAEPTAGKAIAVEQGDTFTMMAGDEKLRVRIQGIDAPEPGQPFFREAKDRLSELILDKDIRVQIVRKRLDHIDGLVSVGTDKVGDMMLEEGLAWRYFHNAGTSQFSKIERTARLKKKGLWGGENPIPPWEWRRDHPRQEVEELVTEEDLAGLSPELREKHRQLVEELDPEATLTLYPHRSRVIRTRAPILRFTVTVPDVLTVVQVAPNEFELIGGQPGLTTFNIWFVNPSNGQEATLRYVVFVKDEVPPAGASR